VSIDDPNRTILVIGYGSLLSGYGLLGERRGGRSRLVAIDAHVVRIHNARRGLAKPSSHGSYLAMDIEPIDRTQPLTANIVSREHKGHVSGGIGGLLLTFDRADARLIAQREEYDPDAFEKLLAIAERAKQPLGEFLAAIARDARHDLLEYRRRLYQVVGYTSPGYIFHPVEIDDGRTAIVAIGSGFDGSGHPEVLSKRAELNMDRLLAIHEALAHGLAGFDRAGQLGYFAECLLGGIHGVDVSDLADAFDPDAEWAIELAESFHAGAGEERDRFLRATGLDAARYQDRFTASHHPSLTALLKLARLG
jgi:hypothetical protein